MTVGSPISPHLSLLSLSLSSLLSLFSHIPLLSPCAGRRPPPPLQLARVAALARGGAAARVPGGASSRWSLSSPGWPRYPTTELFRPRCSHRRVAPWCGPSLRTCRGSSLARRAPPHEEEDDISAASSPMETVPRACSAS
jgi:hypothetical protein